MKLATPPASLAFRLSCWYACSAFLLLLAITTFLYFGLVRSFNREDNQYLSEKVRTLQTLLREHPQQYETVQWEVQGESLTHASMRVLSRVIIPGGSVMIETDGMGRELGAGVFPQPSPSSPLLTPSKEIRTVAGRTFQVLSASVPVDDSGTQRGYTVQVAIDLTVQKRLLDRYRTKIWIVLGFGLIACVLIGYRIADEGIRPLNNISKFIARTRSPDFSERVELEGLPTELRDLAAVFNELMDRLNDSFGRLSRFCADIAHELRTPVNNLLGEIHVAISRVRTPGDYHELLGSLSEECDQLKNLIDSLLFLARAEHPETQVNREDLDIGREVGLVRDFYSASAGEAGIAIHSSVAEAVRFPLDRILFQRALGNLVQNALAHTPSGGQVEISVTSNQAGLLVCVSDNGIGISPEHLPRVLDRFYRIDRARAKDTGGTGLGLAIVQSIVALHGGNIEITSELGKGTKVTLSFANEAIPAQPETRHQLQSS